MYIVHDYGLWRLANQVTTCGTREGYADCKRAKLRGVRGLTSRTVGSPGRECLPSPQIFVYSGAYMVWFYGRSPSCSKSPENKKQKSENLWLKSVNSWRAVGTSAPSKSSDPRSKCHPPGACWYFHWSELRRIICTCPS